MLTFGSATSAVRLFAMPPVARPCQPKCQGMPTWCTIRRRMRIGCSRSVTSARASASPRGVLTITQSPVAMARSAASAGLISTKPWGWSSASQGSQRLMPPAVWCSVSRYVVMM